MKLTRRVLYNRARSVDFRYPVKNEILAEKMFDFMIRNHGIGLAAPQVGLAQRVFVMQVHGHRRACFNPEIVETSPDLVDYTEGCLSFPGESCTIMRPNTIWVQYQDARGSVIQTELTGLESRCFQHELDHLEGITMHERAREHNAEQS